MIIYYYASILPTPRYLGKGLSYNETGPRGRLNIKISSYQYRIIFIVEIPIPVDIIFILKWDPGPRLNIKTVFPRYGDSNVKDKTVGETVLSLTWESLYW